MIGPMIRFEIAAPKREGREADPNLGVCTDKKDQGASSMSTQGTTADTALPDDAPVRRSSLGPALNGELFNVGGLERSWT
jgi:hypothetical protein